jgi:benzoyl-CoA reductase/2-hydroxyglutaryl-CoA dehydratase subunit BcrC/BadD/HgdB
MGQPWPLPSRQEAIRDHRAVGGRIAAVFPIHYPRALLRAFGLLPVEVWGPPGQSTTSGDAHLQAYTCSIVRCGLSFLLDGGLDDVDVIVSPHACDSLQGLGSLMLDFVQPRQLVLPLYIPRGSRASDTTFLARELRSAFDRLTREIGETPTDDELMASVELEARADAALRRLARLLPPGRERYRVLRAREYLPAERFLELARIIDAELGPEGADKPSATTRAGRVPIVLSGLVPEPMELFDVLETAGADVVADDLANVGRRFYPDGKSTDPFRRMAEQLLGGPPDPTRGCSIEQRVSYLAGLAEEHGARGVLFYDVKFCEPEQFYLPRTRTELEARGLRSLAVEVDIADPLGDQLVTRIEAFVESLL